MTTEKLEPCPWCGKEPRMLGDSEMIPDFYFVQCDHDGHEVSGPVRKTRAGAIKAWNERRVK